MRCSLTAQKLGVPVRFQSAVSCCQVLNPPDPWGLGGSSHGHLLPEYLENGAHGSCLGASPGRCTRQVLSTSCQVGVQEIILP